MILRHSGRLAAALAGVSASAAWAVETLRVGTDVFGTTPVALGYNLGHFAEDSNAEDWFRYSGAASARQHECDVAEDSCKRNREACVQELVLAAEAGDVDRHGERRDRREPREDRAPGGA